MPSPVDSLQLAYGDRRYRKMTNELNHGTDIIRVKEIQIKFIFIFENHSNASYMKKFNPINYLKIY